MPLPNELEKIKKRLEDKGSKRSPQESALLSELQQLDTHLNRQVLNEINARVTKMTGPGDDVCQCCGRPL